MEDKQVTSSSSVVQKFLSLIDDYELALLEDEDIEYISNQFLDASVATEFPEAYDIELIDGEFNRKLTADEEWIIAYGMALGWIRRNIHKKELMRESISNRDFTESSHATQLQALISTLGHMEDRLEKMRFDYDFKKRLRR